MQLKVFFYYNFMDCMVSVFFLPITAADAVVRNVYYKYFHPKEALVSNGVLNRFVVAAYVIFLTQTYIGIFQ